MFFAQRLVKFVGGPFDGLECCDDSADRFESSIAIVWSLFRIGCGGPLTLPEMLKQREGRRQRNRGTVTTPRAGSRDDLPVAQYRVVRRALQGKVLVSVAWHAPARRGSRDQGSANSA